ncbi:MAG TPA: A24 family peptidase [Candidatus Acidoferrales bacterium]|nr:A24 family peptidase [Candidatus Acidoferrales bacterium]
MIDAAQALAFGATLTCGVIDARTGFIPNRITYPTFAAILTAAVFAGGVVVSLTGALCVGGALLFLYLVTRRRGLGLGDVKLGVCIGAGLGPGAGMAALGASFIAGGTVGSYLLLSGRAGRKDAVRFGPFLLVGVTASLLAQLLGWQLL